MPDISITEAQHDRLEAVRRDLEETYVDEYGRVHLEDTIQYLLDTYTPPEDRERADAYDRIATADYPTLQRVASDADGVPGSGIDTDEMRGRLLSELGPDALAAELVAATGDGPDDAPAETDSGETATEAPTEAEMEETETKTERSADTELEDARDATDSPVEETADPATSSGSILASANQLLREHDGKWRESDGETRYEVDLPDGSTEPARTKDDVRQILFRHY